MSNKIISRLLSLALVLSLLMSNISTVYALNESEDNTENAQNYAQDSQQENQADESEEADYIGSDIDELLKQKTEQSDDELENKEEYEPADIVTIIVELDGEPLATRTSGNARSALSMEAQIEMEHENAKQEISSLMSSGRSRSYSANLEAKYDYYTVINGFAIEVEYRYLEQIKELSGVKNAFIEETFTAPETAESDSTSYGNSSSLDMVGAQETDYTGEGTSVAVVDTGLEVSHEAFQGDLADDTVAYTETDISEINASGDLNGVGTYVSEKIPFAYDYADNDGDVNPSSNLYHGTHVAGIVGANSGDEIVGVAPDTQLVILKVFDDANGYGYTTNIIAAIEDAVVLGVDVINMSLGSDAGFSSDADETWDTVYNSVAEAGITMSVAAGNNYSSALLNNSGSSIPFVTDPDSSLIASPASYTPSLAVASVNVSSTAGGDGTGMTMSNFSSWGVTPDLKLKPEITAPGGNIYSSLLDNSYGIVSGTSMATPAVAGLSAIVKEYVNSDEKFEGMSDDEKDDLVSALLMSTATPVVDEEVEYDTYYTPRKQGAGLANAVSATSSLAYIEMLQGGLYYSDRFSKA